MLNHSMIRIGYFASTAISSEVSIDTAIVKPLTKPTITLPNEGISFYLLLVYYSEAFNLAVLLIRSRIITVRFGYESKGKMKVFEEDLKTWIESSEFARVFVIGSIMATPLIPRESNQQ